MDMDEIRVIVADDHELVRDGLCRIVESEDDMVCIGVAKNGLESIKLVDELKPDVALIDVAMPDMDGIEATREIKKKHPETSVLVVSAYDYEHFVLACLDAEADGYVLKTNLPGKDLVSAIRMVYRGVSVFDRESSKLVHKLASGQSKHVPGPSLLGQRELKVLELAAAGLSNKQIALELNISNQTVGTHFINIFRKLNVQSRMEAVLHAIGKGWIKVPKDKLEEKGNKDGS